MIAQYLMLFILFNTFSLHFFTFQVNDENYTKSNNLNEVYDKIVGNLNVNCTKSDDCNIKGSVCDTALYTCECDSTTMQIQNKCKAILCESNAECNQKYSYSLCTSGRCQCMSGMKIHGKCLKTFDSSKYLPEWAIVLISLSIALSALLGGTVKKKAVRRQFQSIFILLMRLLSLYNQSEQNSASETDNSVSENNIKEDDNSKEEIELDSKL